ncbi:hypothetical protein A2U01_0068503, partial [Trifolium medium]|nr:hypothetical protein [Trifolium medium]
RLTDAFTVECDAQQATLPVSLRDPDNVRHRNFLNAFVDYAGGRRRSRTFVARSISSFIQRTRSRYIDTGDTSTGQS